MFFSAATLVICVFSLLFYFDFTSRSAIGQERIVGSIAFKKRIAQRKYSEQVVWDDIEQMTPVYNNDSIRTADLSEAVIRLADGTEIMVNENSMIQLSFTTNEIDIQFKGGSISTKRSDVAGDTINKLNIKTGETTVSVAKSDVQISGGNDKGVNLVVNRGNATVTTGGKEKAVKQNQKAIIERGSQTMKIYTLPLRPLTPLPDSVIVTAGTTGPVAFSWEELKNERDGILEISDSVSFARIITARKITGASVSVTMPNGLYFWRLRAKNMTSGIVYASEVRKFTIVRVEPAYLIYPDQGHILQYGKTKPVINFKWSGSDVAQEYNLEIASDPTMRKITVSHQTQEKSIAIDIPGEGTYYWRVISLTRVSGTISRVSSTVRMMTLSRKKIIEPPVPQFPPDKSTVSGKVLQEKGVIFSWLNTEDIQASRVIISSDADFKNVIFSGTSGTNFITIKRQLEPGIYYWRINGILAGNQGTEPSSVMKFSVITGTQIKLAYPSDSSEVVSDGNGKEVKLSWEKSDMYGEYVVQVSSNKSFSNIEKEELATGNNAVISGVKPGKYYWRVLLRNNEGSIAMSSRPNSFVVLDTLSEPTILSPVNRQIIDMDNLNELDLRWKRLADANAYRFRLYRIDAKKTKMLTERMIRGTNYGLSDMNFPGEGEYLWSIQGFEMNKDGSRVIRKSPVSQSRFIIQASAATKKIKIITPRVIYME
jgi:hypothetical protein